MRMRVRFPLDQLTAQLRQAQGLLASDKKRHLEAVGVQLLSFSQQAYRQKARGNQGADGIKWAKLKRSTLKARVMRRAQGKKLVQQRKDIARQIQQSLGTGKRKRRSVAKVRKRGILSRLKRGIGRAFSSKSPTKAIRRQLKTINRRIKSMPKVRGRMTKVKRKSLNAQRKKLQSVLKLRKKRLELLLKLEQLVDREMGKYEIGVDTGLQRSSAVPGFVGSDGKGGNLLKVTESSVTVGYNRNYSEFFDAKRPLLPGQLPGPWAARFDRMTEKWGTDVMNRAFRGGP